MNGTTMKPINYDRVIHESGSSSLTLNGQDATILDLVCELADRYNDLISRVLETEL
jgi:hypothetical protein